MKKLLLPILALFIGMNVSAQSDEIELFQSVFKLEKKAFDDPKIDIYSCNSMTPNCSDESMPFKDKTLGGAIQKQTAHRHRW